MSAVHIEPVATSHEPFAAVFAPERVELAERESDSISVTSSPRTSVPSTSSGTRSPTRAHVESSGMTTCAAPESVSRSSPDAAGGVCSRNSG
jgi:hypothetical protein